MANDTDIFGDIGTTKKPDDSAIFKDIANHKPIETVSMAPVEPAQQSGLNPQQQAAFDNMKNNGWGSGLPKAMYDIGGKVTDMIAGGSHRFPIPPEVAGGLGAATGVIPDALQMALGGNVGATANPVSQSVGRWLMRSALKPPSTANIQKTETAVETMLKEGVNPTVGGVDKLKKTLGSLGQQVDQSVANSGATIDTHAVADTVPNALDRFKNGPQAVPAIADLGNVQKTFIEHPNVGGAREIPVQVAQDMKQGYQRSIGDKGYGELKTPTTEGEKQIARGLREQIAAKVPSVVEPLKRESDIIAALKMAEHRAKVDANKNPLGLGILNPAYLPIWLWDRSTLGKAITGRALYSGNIPALAGAGAGALYGNQGALYQQ